MLLAKMLEPKYLNDSLVPHELRESLRVYENFLERYQVFWTQVYLSNGRQPTSSYSVEMACTKDTLFLFAEQVEA